MNQRDREIVLERYGERLAQHGHDPKTLGWSKSRQPIRFAALTSFVPLDRIESVLDVGCGFGDLHPYLRDQGFRGRYVGLDFNPDLVALGRRAYPEADLRVGDFSELESDERFDLVVASGLFNAPLRFEDPWENMTTMLGRMHAIARVATAADFMSAYADAPTEDVEYTEPEAVLRFAKSLSRRVALRHDYLPFEFAVAIYARDEIAERTTFPPVVPEARS